MSFEIKDTHREKATTNKIPESMNMEISVVDTSTPQTQDVN